MAGFKPAALGAALLTMTLSLPLAAQQPGAQDSTRQAPPKGAAVGASVPDATITKAGAALRDVSAIHQTYSERIASAQTPDEKQGLQKQATDAATKAVGNHGLSVDQYNQIITMAQADPDLGQRLLAAAKSAK